MEEFLAECGELLADSLDYTGYMSHVDVSTDEYTDGYEISARLDDMKADDDSIPPVEDMVISEDHSYYDTIDSVFSDIRSNITTSGVEVSSIVIKPVSDFSDTDVDWKLYTQQDCDYTVFVGFVSHTVPDDIESALSEEVVSDLYVRDPDVSTDMLSEVFYFYSDISEVSLEGVYGQVRTSVPHEYYSEVESVTEYVSQISDTAEEYDELIKQGVFTVDWRLDTLDSLPPESVCEVGNSAMTEFIEDTVSIAYPEYLIEGEGICFGSDLDEGEGPVIRYYGHIPITNGVIGSVN